MANSDQRAAAEHLRLVPSGARDPLSSDTRDEELLAAFWRGDRGVGLRLHDRLLPVVDATLYRILGGRDTDHADLVQTTFEQIVVTLSKRTFAARCSLASWAAAIACHVALSALRMRKRRRGVITPSSNEEAGEPPAMLLDPERQLVVQRELWCVRRHLSEMEPDRATAVLLSAMGHSLAEIAQITNTTPAAAQSRISRGRSELSDRLRNEWLDDAAMHKEVGDG